MKAIQLRTAAECGFNIPKTLITNDSIQARSFLEAIPGEVIAKTVQSPRISTTDSRLAYTHVVSKDETELLSALELAPCIFQEYVPKDVEYRVTVVGNEVLPVIIRSQQVEEARIDWRKADYRRVLHERCELPDETSSRCLAYAKKFNLLFAAIDLIQTPSGGFVFLECNPNGEWAWLEDAAGVPIASTIADLLVANRRT